MIRLLHIPILRPATKEETGTTLTVALDKIDHIVWSESKDSKKATAEIYVHNTRYRVDAEMLKTWLIRVTGG